MKRGYYLSLGAGALRIPIGTDLVLKEQPDEAEIVLDGRRLGEVVHQAARRYRSPLAIPLMDLRLEKADLLHRLGIAEEEIDAWHFAKPPEEGQLEMAESSSEAPFPPRNQAHIEATRHVAEETDLLPMGMAIGPFSLMTKLMDDPITAVAMAGVGMTAANDSMVRSAERCLKLAEGAVARSLRAQAAAGAKLQIVCEPAANTSFISPRMLDRGSDIFERFVMQPALRLKALLDSLGVDLFFHNCGELTPFMVREFAHRIHPVILSLGSSRKLWEDAAEIPEDVVIYGNLPTKNFYSDAVMDNSHVRDLTCKLLAQMRATGRHFILGSECDVLDVPGSGDTIRHKVRIMLDCSCFES